MDLRLIATQTVLACSVLSAALLLAFLSDDAQAMIPRWCCECLPEKTPCKLHLVMTVGASTDVMLMYSGVI